MQKADWMCPPAESIYAGIKHKAADALLRLKTTGTDQTPIDDTIPVLFITLQLPQKRKGEFLQYVRQCPR